MGGNAFAKAARGQAAGPSPGVQCQTLPETPGDDSLSTIIKD
jgi:hypothetical protein